MILCFFSFSFLLLLLFFFPFPFGFLLLVLSSSSFSLCLFSFSFPFFFFFFLLSLRLSSRKRNQHEWATKRRQWYTQWGTLPRELWKPNSKIFKRFSYIMLCMLIPFHRNCKWSLSAWIKFLNIFCITGASKSNRLLRKLMASLPRWVPWVKRRILSTSLRTSGAGRKVQEPPANQKTKKSKRNFFSSVPQDMALIPGSFTKLSPKRFKRKWAGKHWSGDLGRRGSQPRWSWRRMISVPCFHFPFHGQCNQIIFVWARCFL